MLSEEEGSSGQDIETVAEALVQSLQAASEQKIQTVIVPQLATLGIVGTKQIEYCDVIAKKISLVCLEENMEVKKITLASTNRKIVEDLAVKLKNMPDKKSNISIIKLILYKIKRIQETRMRLKRIRKRET